MFGELQEIESGVEEIESDVREFESGIEETTSIDTDRGDATTPSPQQ